MSSKTLPLIDAYRFGEENGLAEEVSAIRRVRVRGQMKRYQSPVRRGFIVELFLKHNLQEDFEAKYWPFGNTAQARVKRAWYLKKKAEFELSLAEASPVQSKVDDDDEEESEESKSFASEANLRDYLSKNMGLIEPGLSLFEKEGRYGVEYPVQDGRIDLLGIDSAGRLVVIELKLTRGRNRTLGQLLYYMGWVDQNLEATPCRGVILAREITDDLVLAVQRVEGVTLFRYALSVSVERVESASHKV